MPLAIFSKLSLHRKPSSHAHTDHQGDRQHLTSRNETVAQSTKLIESYADTDKQSLPGLLGSRGHPHSANGTCSTNCKNRTHQCHPKFVIGGLCACEPTLLQIKRITGNWLLLPWQMFVMLSHSSLASDVLDFLHFVDKFRRWLANMV